MTVKDTRRAYLKAPTWEQIQSFVDEVGVCYVHFEEYYGMGSGILKNVKGGWRQLPKKHWHIFYERIVPQYGAMNNFKKPNAFKVSKPVKNRKSSPSPLPSHNRLTSIS